MQLFAHDYDYIIIVGATGSGKSSLAKKLVDSWGIEYRKVFTTRPARPGELDTEYMRVTPEEMDSLEQNNLLMSRIKPKTAHGIWEYGIPTYSRLIHTDHTNVQAIGMNDLENLMNVHGPGWFPYNSLMIALYVDRNTLSSKLKETRGDDEESTRRIKSDLELMGETPQDNTMFQRAVSDMYKKNEYFRVFHILNHHFQFSVENIIKNIQSYQRNVFYNRTFTILNKEFTRSIFTP